MPAPISGRSARVAIAVLALAVMTAAAASEVGKRPGHGLIGFGIDMYVPVCADACGSSVPMWLWCPPLDSSQHTAAGMSMAVLTKRHLHKRHSHSTDDTPLPPNEHGLIATKNPSLECIANNTAYLQSVAWCIATHCPASVSPVQREAWWWHNVVGRNDPQPDPAMTYQQALGSIDKPPTLPVDADAPLGEVRLVSEDTYAATAAAEGNFADAERKHELYSIIIITTCVILPIALSLLRFLPFPDAVVSRVRGVFVDARLSQRRLPLVGSISITRGQALFALYMVAINAALSFAGVRTVTPNSWFDTPRAEAMAHIANRTGVLSFANLALAILYAGRNDMLLWLTNWSYPTFLLLHRCAAVIATVQACVHSAMYLHIYLAPGAAALANESRQAYWYWGIVGTLAMSLLLLPLSIRAVRAAAYEAFLVGHIVLAILTIAGCWWHIIFRYSHQWGYETWLYVAMAVWGFDRLLRVVRIVGRGICYAMVYKVDDDYLRIDINVHATGFVYTYFPTITYWGLPRPWENHPFSIAAYGADAPAEPVQSAPSDTPLTVTNSESEKSGVARSPSSTSTVQPERRRSITVFVRIRKGITKQLAARAVPLGDVPRPIPVLVEGSYGHNSVLTKSHPDLPDALFIAGGVGITAFLPHLLQTAYAPDRRGSVSLHWGVRSAPLVHAVEDIVAQHTRTTGANGVWGAVDAHVSVGTRLFLADIVARQLQQSAGTVVYVSGPDGMIEELRDLVMEHAARGAVVHFCEEMFKW